MNQSSRYRIFSQVPKELTAMQNQIKVPCLSLVIALIAVMTAGIALAAPSQQKSITLDDARKALADLAAEKPAGIYASAEEIQKAPAIVNATTIDLLKFRISLGDKSFVYWAIKTDQVKDYTEGIFVLDANGQWTAKITQRTKAHHPIKKKSF